MTEQSRATRAVSADGRWEVFWDQPSRAWWIVDNKQGVIDTFLPQRIPDGGQTAEQVLAQCLEQQNDG